jgi:hypothetical protein
VTTPRGTIALGGVAVIGLVAAIASFLLSSSSNELEEKAGPAEYRAERRLDARPSSSMVPAIVEAYMAQPHASETNGNSGTSVLVPQEWEQPLFDILMNDEQSMDERNTRLLELATGAARSVPAVQEECLMHLLFGIPDSNASQFLAVTTNSAIPVQMRAEFLKEALAMRPTEIGEWLSQQVSNHHEPAISSVARLYLLDLQKKAQD